MGRKYKHFYEQIWSFENLWLASRKARRGKRQKKETALFEYDLEKNLFEMQEALRTESYEFGAYNHFVITDPQERLVSAAPYRDRVVHHALCNVVEPILDRAMYYHSYACRLGKGLHRALAAAQRFLQHADWILKVDMAKYFFTIDHEVLLGKIERKVTDEKVLRLISRILATHTTGSKYYSAMEGDTLFDTLRPRGLPIGNLTSQLFANYYLVDTDRFLMRHPSCHRMVRYMDDFIVFGKSKAELQRCRDDVEEYLCKQRLQLHETKTQIFPAGNGIPFLGFDVYRDRVRVRRANVQRFRARLKKQRAMLGHGSLAWESLLQSLNAWLGFVGKDKNREYLEHLLRSVSFVHPENKCDFTFCLP